MKVQIKLLRASPFNESIYNSAPTKDLIESIKEKGILQAIWITEDNMIIAGHRRVNACKELGIEEIEAEIREYSDWLVIESNRYREKTLSEKLREAEALEKIWKERGRKKQLSGLKQYQDTVWGNLPQTGNKKPIDTQKEIAETIGMAEKTYVKAKAIKEEAPELIEAIDEGNKTIHGTYRFLKKEKMKNELKEKNFPSDKYRVIYADPPWQYNDKRDGNTTGAEDHYPTMTIQELCDLPVKEITENNAILFLWVTSPLLEDGFKIINSWGFKYKTSFVWNKKKHNMGHYNSVRHEFLLIATKGSCLPDHRILYDSVIEIERTSEHSEKPEKFREIIDSLYVFGRKLELFARKKHKKWETWGNEIT